MVMLTLNYNLFWTVPIQQNSTTGSREYSSVAFKNEFRTIVVSNYIFDAFAPLLSQAFRSFEDICGIGCTIRVSAVA